MGETMSQYYRKWIIEILKVNGPSTARRIQSLMSHRRYCPSMHQLGNYLGKYVDFVKLDEFKPTADTGNVAVWGLKND